MLRRLARARSACEKGGDWMISTYSQFMTTKCAFPLSCTHKMIIRDTLQLQNLREGSSYDW